MEIVGTKRFIPKRFELRTTLSWPIRPMNFRLVFPVEFLPQTSLRQVIKNEYVLLRAHNSMMESAHMGQQGA